MSILEKILTHKSEEVDERKTRVPIRVLEQSIYFERQPVSMRAALINPDKSGIITEIKRKSPSRGVINSDISVVKVSTGYARAGASAISVLTDTKFFGGSNEDLMSVRDVNECPILRKDFVIEEYQIVEARSIGADAILLIAAALEPSQIKELCDFAHSLRLEVLLEVHDEKELEANLDAGADMIGVNNRNLKTFELNVDLSRKLAPAIPESFVKVSESGIESPDVILDLKAYGFRGFLIGQTFMQAADPELAALEFINQLNALERARK